jgi:hypothetical protein
VLLETNRNISGLSFGNTTSKVKGPLVSTPGSDPGDALEVFESLAARSKFTGFLVIRRLKNSRNNLSNSNAF